MCRIIKKFEFDTFYNFNNWHKRFIQTNIIIEETIIGGYKSSIIYTAKVEKNE